MLETIVNVELATVVSKKGDVKVGLEAIWILYDVPPEMSLQSKVGSNGVFIEPLAGVISVGMDGIGVAVVVNENGEENALLPLSFLAETLQ